MTMPGKFWFVKNGNLRNGQKWSVSAGVQGAGVLLGIRAKASVTTTHWVAIVR